MEGVLVCEVPFFVLMVLIVLLVWVSYARGSGEWGWVPLVFCACMVVGTGAVGMGGGIECVFF